MDIHILLQYSQVTMSDDERRTLSPHPELDEAPLPVDEEPLIAPLAPRVVPLEESQVEVSASPAFQVLDEVSGGPMLVPTTDITIQYQKS
ncbi:Hypp3141 [Branchiostoma lanceolatum]|uniref:Hypp3141 protein n=1 Tax=Branchiostoma lanceolatum TaxID=7740 RepID=A0A8J9ZXP2_BRALA|nr:Hypp3141 [Branchiostoma lanceolatum]